MDDMEERMKKKMNEEKEGSTEFDDLPRDIILDIFSRIPLGPLFTFRSVSKQWCKLIDHPHLSLIHIKQDHPFPFICDHYPFKNTARLHTVRLLPRDYSPLKNIVHLHNRRRLQASPLPLLEFDFPSSPYLGSCNGLLFFAPTRYSIILSNPRQSLQLPPIPITSFSSSSTVYGLGFDSRINIFKMVCVIFNEFTMILNLNVGGPMNSWRKISQLPPCPLCYIPVFSRGFLYWKVDPHYALYDKLNSLIVSFDVENEVFSFVPHPHSSRGIQLLDLNGNIAIVDYGKNFGSFTVSVMKDYQRKKWSILYSVPISFPKQVTSLGKNGEILIRIKGCFYIYHPIEDYLEYADEFKSPQKDHRPIVHSFTGSLFSLSNVTE